VALPPTSATIGVTRNWSVFICAGKPASNAPVVASQASTWFSCGVWSAGSLVSMTLPTLTAGATMLTVDAGGPRAAKTGAPSDGIDVFRRPLEFESLPAVLADITFGFPVEPLPSSEVPAGVST